MESVWLTVRLVEVCVSWVEVWVGLELVCMCWIGKLESVCEVSWSVCVELMCVGFKLELVRVWVTWCVWVSWVETLCELGCKDEVCLKWVGVFELSWCVWVQLKCVWVVVCVSKMSGDFLCVGLQRWRMCLKWVRMYELSWCVCEFSWSVCELVCVWGSWVGVCVSWVGDCVCVELESWKECEWVGVCGGVQLES